MTRPTLLAACAAAALLPIPAVAQMMPGIASIVGAAGVGVGAGVGAGLRTAFGAALGWAFG